MNRSTGRVAFPALFVGLIVLLAGCMDASLSQSGDAPAGISILGAPSTLGDIDLTISGSGMSDINKTVSRNNDELVLDVPVGPDRQFGVLGYLNGDTTAFYEAISTVGVTPGGAQVTLPMALRSQILVPDDNLNQVVRFASLENADSTTQFLSSGDLGVGSMRDVDFDSQGRIYIAGDEMARVDTFGATGVLTDFLSNSGFNTVAVDREDGALYAATNMTITKANLDGTDEISSWLGYADLISYDLFYIQGLAVDSDGFLYAAQAPGVTKIDPDTRSVVAQFDLPSYPGYGDGISDVMVKDNSVFVLNLGAHGDNRAIYNLSRDDLTVIDSYGQLTTPAEANEPGKFVVPLRFVATLNRKITIAEGDGNGFGFARIVSMDDMDGSGWQTYGTAGSGAGVVGDFQLYAYGYGGS